MKRMSQERTVRQYVEWALTTFGSLQESPENYLYYFPFGEEPLMQRFRSEPSPLPLERLCASRLVPANLRTRIPLVLEYHQWIGGTTTMVWSPPTLAATRPSGVLIAWYEQVGLWGATDFDGREGKGRSTWAQRREALLEQVLGEGQLPRLDLLSYAQGLPGMTAILPVVLPSGGPCSLLLQRYSIEGVSDHEPWLVLPHRLPEWLVTLLYEGRQMPLDYACATIPTVTHVLEHLLARMSLLEQCGGEEEWKDDDLPYQVAMKQRYRLKKFLGSAYVDVLQTFRRASHVPSSLTALT